MHPLFIVLPLLVVAPVSCSFLVGWCQQFRLLLVVVAAEILVCTLSEDFIMLLWTNRGGPIMD